MKLFERFSRQQKIKGWDQKKVNKTNVAVVGCGGLGSIVAIQCAMLGVGSIKLIDHDLVEESNLNRQFFFEEDIRKGKADALKDKLKKINSKLLVTSLTKRIEDLINEKRLLDMDYIFDCLDNIKTRKILNEYCVKNNIKLIHAGCDDKIGEVQVIIPKETACMECMPYPEELEKDRRSCNDFDPAICTTNFIVASLEIEAFLNHLFNGRKTEKNWVSYRKGYGINFGLLERNKECGVCA